MKSIARKVYRELQYSILWAANSLGDGPKSKVPIEAVSPLEKYCFFGYHDKIPWNLNGRYILCMKTKYDKKMPSAGELATICMIDKSNNNQLLEIGATSAWCWQQGAMLQWICEHGEERILYNDVEDGNFVTRILNSNGSLNRTLLRPTYAISPDARSIVSLNFNRLDQLAPGYGYSTRGSNPLLDEKNDGLYLFGNDGGNDTLFITLEQLIDLDPRPEFSRAVHYVNHIQFSPDSKRFVFFHRWVFPPNLTTNTRVYVVSQDGKELRCLFEGGWFSHYCWLDNSRIIATCKYENTNIGYFIINVITGSVQQIGKDCLDRDGHPGLSPLGRWIVTDTYPDKLRKRTLLLYDPITQKRIDIAQFFVPSKYEGALRCDLHPRWNREGTQICIDSSHEGYRRLYVIDVCELLMKMSLGYK